LVGLASVQGGSRSAYRLAGAAAAPGREADAKVIKEYLAKNYGS
jgi:hypothetical protein